MAFFYQLDKNQKFLFTISLIFTLLLTSVDLINSNEIQPTNESNSINLIDTQIPMESNVYYEYTIGFAYCVCVSGDYAYVTDSIEGLVIMDISDPTDPVTIASKSTPEKIGSIQVSGDYL